MTAPFTGLFNLLSARSLSCFKISAEISTGVLRPCAVSKAGISFASPTKLYGCWNLISALERPIKRFTETIVFLGSVVKNAFASSPYCVVDSP